MGNKSVYEGMMIMTSRKRKGVKRYDGSIDFSLIIIITGHVTGVSTMWKIDFI